VVALQIRPRHQSNMFAVHLCILCIDCMFTFTNLWYLNLFLYVIHTEHNLNKSQVIKQWSSGGKLCTPKSETWSPNIHL